MTLAQPISETLSAKQQAIPLIAACMDEQAAERAGAALTQALAAASVR